MRLIRADGSEEEIDLPRPIARSRASDDPILSALGREGARSRDPHRRALVDPFAFHSQDDAFRGFRPSATFERYRRLVGAGEHEVRETPEPSFDPPLPTLWCGAPGRTTPRCGRPLRSKREKGDAYAYKNQSCWEKVGGHRAFFEPSIELPILRAIASAYTVPPRPEFAANLARTTDEIERRLRLQDEELARCEDRIVRLTRTQVDAGDLRQEAFALTLQADLTLVLSLKAHIAEDHRMLAATRFTPERLRLFETLKSLTKRIDRVLLSASAVPGLTRQLVDILTQAIALTYVAPTIVLAEITFPNGVATQQLITTGPFRSSQPQRLWSATQLRLGRTPETLAPELHAAWRGRQVARTVSPADVLSLGLHHAYFETAAPLDPSRGRTLATLSRLTSTPFDTLQQLAMSGDLGPARVGPTGALLVDPTAATLEDLLEGHARRETARRAGWAVEDTVGMQLVHQASRDARPMLRSMIQRGALTAATDLAGRRYVHWPSVTSAFAACGRPLPNRSYAASFEAARVEAVTRAGHTSDMAVQFDTVREIVRQLRVRFQIGTAPTLAKAARAGRVTAVSFQGASRSGKQVTYPYLVRCPPDILAADDRTAAVAWWNAVCDKRSGANNFNVRHAKKRPS